MVTTDIPRDEWHDFFESFSRVHQGWLCTVQVASPTGGTLTQARDLALSGIHGDTAIHVALGEVSHDIYAPDRVRLVQDEAGADVALEVDSGDSRTSLSFRLAALPETVGDMA